MENRLSYVDALRGYAILGVILAHTVGFTAGAMGVQLFYIVSAFSLFLSLKNRTDENGGYLYFLIRRFFRIAPLFYLSILFYFYNDQFMPRPLFWSGGEPITIITLLPKVFFINAWHPYWLNSVVPGSWSVAVEMSFYLLIPILYKKLKNIKNAIWFTTYSLIGSIIINCIFSKYRLVEQTDLWNYFLYFWLPNQLPVFSLGIVLFFLVKDFNNNRHSLPILLASLLILFTITKYTKTFFEPTNKIYFLYGICFMLFAYGLSIKQYKLFVNRFITFIGKISYSAYLCHFVIINISMSMLKKFGIGGIMGNILLFITVVTLTIILSYFLYLTVEKQGIKIASNIIKHLKSKNLLVRNDINIS